jgi:hypothetical protein
VITFLEILGVVSGIVGAAVILFFFFGPWKE